MAVKKSTKTATKKSTPALKTADVKRVSRARAVGTEVLGNLMLPPKVVAQIAEEVAKSIIEDDFFLRRCNSDFGETIPRRTIWTST